MRAICWCVARIDIRIKCRARTLTVPFWCFPHAAPERLPEDCRAVLSLNAVKWVADYRDSCFKKLLAALQLR